MGLLKFLFIAITILWLVRLVVRLLLPWAMRKLAQKVMRNTQGQYPYGNGDNRSSRQQQQPEGEIRIDYVPPQQKNKQGAKTAGEFVEFEEVKSSAK